MDNITSRDVNGNRREDVLNIFQPSEAKFQTQTSQNVTRWVVFKPTNADKISNLLHKHTALKASIFNRNPSLFKPIFLLFQIVHRSKNDLTKPF